MRKSPASRPERAPRIALLVIAAVTAAACAHPTEDPLPGQSAAPTTSTRTQTSGQTGGDQTEAVCAEALDRSHEVVDEIKAKITEAQANPGSATVALLSVRTAATQWKKDLQEFADRPIRSDVRDALNEGVDLIDELLAKNPQELAGEAEQAQEDIENFLDDLESACA
jgi:hypothetical protein